MKTKSFFLFIIILCCLPVSAQLKVISSGAVGVMCSSPQTAFQINTTRPILFSSYFTNYCGTGMGFNCTVNTSVYPSQLTKLGSTGMYGGASIMTDYYGNVNFQMYNAGTESVSTTTYSPQIIFKNNGSAYFSCGTPYYGGFYFESYQGGGVIPMIKPQTSVMSRII